MNKNQKEMDKVATLAEDTYDAFVMCGKKGDDNIMVFRGAPYQMLAMMNRLYSSIKAEFVDLFESEFVAEMMMRAITFSEEDLAKINADIMGDDEGKDDDETVSDDNDESDKEELRKAIEQLVDVLGNMRD